MRLKEIILFLKALSLMIIIAVALWAVLIVFGIVAVPSTKILAGFLLLIWSDLSALRFELKEKRVI